MKDLLAAMAVDEHDDDTFSARCATGAPGRVFGGQVAAQALFAAAKRAPHGSAPHSAHLYFLRPGNPATRITYSVTALKIGRAYSTFQVHARQGGREILTALCSFCVPEAGPAYQETAPRVPEPEQCPTRALVPPAANGALRAAWEFRDVPLEGDRIPPRQRTWLRARAALTDDPVVQACALTYVTDLTLPVTAHLPLHDFDHYVAGASLDHSIWFHRPFRVEDWLLFDQHTPTFAAARGLSLGRLFDRAGALVASVAQESLIRV